MMSGTLSTLGTLGTITETRNIRIETVPCPLYDYMVLSKLCDLPEDKNREQLEYYATRYSLGSYELKTSILDESGDIINFARNLLFKGPTDLCTSFVNLIKDPNNLVILPTFFESNTNAAISNLNSFFTQSEIEKEFRAVSSVLFQPSPPPGNRSISHFQTILRGVQGLNGRCEGLGPHNVHFLPCIAKSGDKRIKTEKDYLEKLDGSIKRLLARIRDTSDVTKLVFLVDPDNKISLQFYEKKNSSKKIFSSSIEYLNKSLIAALQKKDTKAQYRYRFDDFIDNVQVDKIYTLKGEKYVRELKRGNVESNVLKLHLIANDIIQWLFLGKKEPDYSSLESDILKIFYNENTAKSTFDFKFKTSAKYTLYFANGSGTLNFKLDKRAKKQLDRFYMKNKLKQTVNKKKLSVTPLPNGYFLIDNEERDNLYIKLTHASFGGIIRGELYEKRANIYTKPRSLSDTKGIVRKFDSDQSLVYYNASKINRKSSIEEDNDVRYFKNFLITKRALEDFIKEQGSYKTDTVLSVEMAKIASSQESMSDFYEYCSGHPKHYNTIKQSKKNDVQVQAIDNILQILFGRGTRLYLNSKATSSNSNSTKSKTPIWKEYHIQDFSKLEEIYIPSLNSSSSGSGSGSDKFNTLKEKYKQSFDKASDVSDTHSVAVLDIYLSKVPPSASSDCKTLKQKILNSSAKILRTIGKNISFKLRRFTT